MGEYINTFTSRVGKVNFWNRKRNTNLISGNACHIEFDFYGRCASLAPLPGVLVFKKTSPYLQKSHQQGTERNKGVNPIVQTREAVDCCLNMLQLKFKSFPTH